MTDHADGAPREDVVARRIGLTFMLTRAQRRAVLAALKPFGSPRSAALVRALEAAKRERER